MKWLDDLYLWTLKYDPRTWAGHSALASLIALIVGVVVWRFARQPWALSLAVGVVVAVTVYTGREVLEVWGAIPDARRKAFDHMMDVICPAFALQIVYRVLTWNIWLA